MTSTTISNVRVFEGERTLENHTVMIDGTATVSIRRRDVGRDGTADPVDSHVGGRRGQLALTTV